MTFLPRATVMLFAAMALFLSFATAAKAETSAYEEFVQQLGQQALDTLDQDDISEEKLAGEMRNWISRYFDADTIARFTLGRYWRVATEAEKKEYMELFREMVVNTYSGRLSDYSGETFEIRGSTRINDRDVMVHTRIIPTRRGAPTTQVDWRVRTINGEKQIIDVNVEGVSMSVTQRNEFSSVIQNGGGKVEALLVSLRDRVQ